MIVPGLIAQCRLPLNSTRRRRHVIGRNLHRSWVRMHVRATCAQKKRVFSGAACKYLGELCVVVNRIHKSSWLSGGTCNPTGFTVSSKNNT
jgi:hypothetical protein